MRIVSCTHTDNTICAACLLFNVRNERMSLGEAVARIRLAAPIYDEASIDEGWAIFNFNADSEYPEDYLETGVEKFDEEAIFASDDAALDHIAARAAAGSAPHLATIVIEGACNAIRAAIWGEQWIDSRMGPNIIAA